MAFKTLQIQRSNDTVNNTNGFKTLQIQRDESNSLLNKVKSEKLLRQEQGLPVSVRDDRAEPTVAGSLIRGMIKPFANVATNIVQAGQVLGTGEATEAPLSNSYLGKVEGLGKVDITKMPWEKENLKVIAKSAGTGAEIASYLGAGGAAKGVVTNIFAQPLKQFVKTQGVNLLKEGATQGLAYSLGTQSQEWADDGTPFSLKQILTDTALSTVLTPVAGFGLNKLFGRRLPSILKDKNINNLLKEKNWGIITGTREAVTSKEFPQAFMHPYNVRKNKELYNELVAKYGKKNVVELPSSKYDGTEQGVSYFVKNLPEKDAMAMGKKYGQESVLTNKGFVSSDGTWIQKATGDITVGKEAGEKIAYSELPTGQKFSMGIAEDRTQRMINELPGNAPKPVPAVVSKVNNAVDNSLAKKAVGIKQGTVDYLKQNPQEIAGREVRLREVDGKVVIEDGRHTLQAATEQGVTPKFVDVTSEYTGKPSKKIQELLKEEKPKKVSKTIPVEEVQPTQPKVEVSSKSMADDVEEMSNYIEGFDEGQLKQFSSDIRSLPREEIRSVGLGGEKTIQNTIPKSAYYATLKNIAKETNDVELSQMLANSPVRSKSGQSLVALQISDKDNLVDDLIEIKKARAKQVGVSDTRYESEATNLFNKIKARIETMKKQIPTIQEVEDIISNKLICK